MKKYLIFIFLLLMPFTVLAETKTINVHLFYQNGCSHCDAEKEFFEKYLEENKDVKLYTYNIKSTEITSHKPRKNIQRCSSSSVENGIRSTILSYRISSNNRLWN